MLLHTINTMENSINQLQAYIQNQPVPQHPQNINFKELAEDKVRQLAPGLDPAMSQLATVMATLQLKSEHETKVATHLLQKTVLETVNSVSRNKEEINHMRTAMTKNEHSLQQVQYNQSQVFSQLAQVYNTSTQSYNLAAENKQRSSKGTFIISGGGIPRPNKDENLYALIFPLVYKKYGIQVQPQEFKELHRLPNNKVLFSLYNRLPRSPYDQLIHAMNSNPNPEIKIYVSIQLFEPYAELYYIARRLKFYKCISNYRLDENGNTQIALQVDKMSFRFTGLDQLKYLGIQVPNQIFQEVAYRRNQISENRVKNDNANNEKANRARPNYNPGPGQYHHPPQSATTRSNYHQNTLTYNSHTPSSTLGHPQTAPRPPSVIQTTGQPPQQDHAGLPSHQQQGSHPGPRHTPRQGETAQVQSFNSSEPFVPAPNHPISQHFPYYSYQNPSIYSNPTPSSTGETGGGRWGAEEPHQGADQNRSQILDKQSRELQADIASMSYDMS